MSTKIINISLPQELVKKVDQLAKRDYTSRSDIIRRALLREVRQPVDEWGDPIGVCDEGIDLRDKNGRGMPAKEFIKLLDQVKAKK
jgi:Arc/MetJ-type ribon-helix-helix transcriptional regulator